MANNIKKYKKIIEENFEYVGEKFTEEAVISLHSAYKLDKN